MNISNGPVRPIPADIDPPKTVCLQIEVPDDRQWIAALYDAIYQLTYWFAWDRDDAHTGAIIAKRWLKAIDTIRLCREVQAPNGCPDPGDDYLLRQNPDNPCLIETSADGTHWCTLIDISLCTPATGQPGGGADQPAPGGGDACYKGTLNAAQSWLLPTVVNAGDVLTFTNVQGAGTDGTGHWYCPDGSIFFAGACVGSLSFDGGDPAPAIHHMALVAKIGAVYYDITAGPITVPGGITTEQVIVQVNDGTLSDNSGDYKFDVCATNNAAVNFTHVFDFTLGLQGWTVGGAGGGVWSPGVGLVTTALAGDKRLTALSPLVPAYTLTSIEFIGSMADAAAGGTRQGLYYDGAYHVSVALPAIAGAFDLPGSAPHAGVTQIGANLDTFANVSGQNVLRKVKVSGTGPDPY